MIQSISLIKLSRLCATFNDLLTHVFETLSDNNADPSVRQNILLTASRLGEISQDLVRRLANEFTLNQFDSSIEYQEKLLSLAKSVANTTAAYVLKAKDIATNVQEQQIVNDVISTATQCALATSQLVACTKVKRHLHDIQMTVCFRLSQRLFPVLYAKNN